MIDRYAKHFTPYKPNWERCRHCNILFTKDEDRICLMCKKQCHRCSFKDNDGKVTYNAMTCVNVERTLFRCSICGFGFDIESKEFLNSTRKGSKKIYTDERFVSITGEEERLMWKRRDKKHREKRLEFENENKGLK